jgi:Holliday junction resolvase
LSFIEKGIGFELKLAELFKQKGYHVTHNIKMKGRSGAEHQIDVLAQYSTPLHTSTIIIEAKSHQNNIDKDTVMKLIQIQQDLSVIGQFLQPLVTLL